MTKGKLESTSKGECRLTSGLVSTTIPRTVSSTEGIYCQKVKKHCMRLPLKQNASRVNTEESTMHNLIYRHTAI
jgi:hypothetical protein